RNICENQVLILSPGVFSSYLWQDGSTQNNFTARTAGSYFVKVTNSHNCAASDTIRINAVIPTPGNFLKSTDTVCSYKPILIEPSGSYSDYLWSNGSTQ